MQEHPVTQATMVLAAPGVLLVWPVTPEQKAIPATPVTMVQAVLEVTAV